MVNAGNFPGSVSTSAVYFRPGTGEQGAAQELGAEFGLRVEPRSAGVADAAQGLLVVVNEDYVPRSAR